jgi:hypothetical protein
LLAVQGSALNSQFNTILPGERPVVRALLR